MTSPTEAAPPKKSRLPFKRVVRRISPDPGSSEKQDADEDDSLDFFRHSKLVFAEVIQEQEERLRERDQRYSSDALGCGLDDHDQKRRKVSLDDSSEESDVVPRVLSGSPAKRFSTPLSLTSVAKERRNSLDADGNDALIMDQKGKGKANLRPSTTPSRTPRSARSQHAVPVPDELATLSNLQRGRQNSESWRQVTESTTLKYEEDDDSDCFILDKSPALETSLKGEAEESQKTDPPDEFDEFVKKARERQKKAKLEAEQAAAAKSAAGESEAEPIVNILLTSQMSGAKPLMVRRRLDQTMAIVLQTWIAKHVSQEGIMIPPDEQARLFLTWRGNKVFGTTTPRSLGVQIDAEGRVKRHPGDDDSGYHSGGLMLEVWTEDTFQDYLQEKERHMRQSRGEIADEDIDALGGGEPAPEPQRKKKGIKVSLKAKDSEPIKLTVRRDNTILDMISAFRTQKSLGPDIKISVLFDGEPTDEESQVNDYDIDIDDVNQFEVHIR